MAKELPEDRKPLAQKRNRGRELSRENDRVKNVSVGLQDIDSAIFYYFDNVIKPDINEAGERVKVPIMYANPERWAAIQRMGSLRDKKRKLIVPAIAFRRTSMQKDETIPVDKLDPQQPKLYQTYQSQYTRENRYDKLTATKGISPKKEMYAVSVPDYMVLNYDFIIWTSFTDQMNQIVEKINWAEGSYWGEPGKFRFRTTIDSFEDASEYEGQRRNIKTNFSVTLRGYLLPESFNPTNTEKFITPKQLVVTNETDVNILPVTDIDSDGAKSIRVVTTTGGAGGGGTGGGGSDLQIKDNGTVLTSAATSITFTGAGLTTTNDGTKVTVNAPLQNTAAQISGANAADSASFSTRISTLESDPGGVFVQTGSSFNTTNSLEITGSLAVTGNVTAQQYIVSSSVTYVTESFLSGSHVFGDTVDDVHQFTGSIRINSGATSSTSIYASNIQNGYPTSNQWKSNLEGSYFNNFDNTTHISEILRFMAGVMSHSLDVADASPNTKTFSSITPSYSDGSETSKSSLFNGVLGSTYENARLSNSWTGSGYIDITQTGSYKEVLDYLELKGWVQSSDRGTTNNDVGTNPFHGTYATRIPSTITTQATFGTFSHTISANAGGSTIASSNANYFGLGSLTSGGPTQFKVRVIATQSFSDNYADSTPDQSSTFTTSSKTDYTTSAFGTSGDGLILAKINTAQPAVIPSAYQDGDFTNVAGAISGRKYSGGATSATSVSASGYYAYHGVKAGIATGSQATYTFKNASDSTTRFYIYTGGLPTDITTGAPNVVVTGVGTRTAFSATSRSLSGAPYILTSTYSYTFNSQVSKSFDPGFGYNSDVLSNVMTNNQWGNIGSSTLNNTTTTVSNTGVSSTGLTNYVIDKTFTTKRTSGQAPEITDIAVASSSYSFTLSSNSDNVVQLRSSQDDKNYNLKFRAKGFNWKGSRIDDDTVNFKFYDAALYGQHADSGSMAIYSRPQGYDPTLITSTTEAFDGEDFRIVLADNVTTFTGAYFTTDSFQTNDNGDAVLGDYDLQVKPSYLVDPGGSYGYWFPANFGSGTYKYYIRRFQASSGTKTSMTVNVGKTLVNWDSTSDGIAVALILKSGTSAGGNTSISTCRLYDPSATTSNLIESGIATDYHKNPFTSNIDLYGNTGGNISSTTYTVPMRNSDGMFIDNTDQELYVIVRYKSDPQPVRSINLSYS